MRIFQFNVKRLDKKAKNSDFNTIRACLIQIKIHYRSYAQSSTYVIGSLLFLTGLLGYLVQDAGLTLKLKGPLANNAKFVLSDGAQTREMDFIPCPESAGENVWWLAHKLNEDHARVASQKILRPRMVQTTMIFNPSGMLHQEEKQ